MSSDQPPHVDGFALDPGDHFFLAANHIPHDCDTGRIRWDLVDDEDPPSEWFFDDEPRPAPTDTNWLKTEPTLRQRIMDWWHRR